MSKRGQTATEYLVLGGVVIIIGLIVVSVLGGVSVTGSKTPLLVNKAEFMTNANVGIMNAFRSESGSGSFVIQNNKNQDITVTSLKVWVDGTSYTLYSSQLVINIGSEKTITVASLPFPACVRGEIETYDKVEICYTVAGTVGGDYCEDYDDEGFSLECSV